MIEVTLEESYSANSDHEKLKRQHVECFIHERYAGQAFGFKQKTLSVGPNGKTLNVSSFIVLYLVLFIPLSAVMLASLWLFFPGTAYLLRSARLRFFQLCCRCSSGTITAARIMA